MPCIMLTEDDFMCLSETAVGEILELVQRRCRPLEDLDQSHDDKASTPRRLTANEFPMPGGESSSHADLSERMAQEFLRSCSEKTKTVLRVIIAGGPNFRQKEIEEKVRKLDEEKFKDISGVWGALTKRTRSILGDKKAFLIDWQKDFYDENEDWMDAEGMVSPATRASFKKVLGIK